VRSADGRQSSRSLEQGRLHGPPRFLALLLAQLHDVAPQVTFAVDVDEGRSAHGQCSLGR
jgi:hypothetical protein